MLNIRRYLEGFEKLSDEEWEAFSSKLEYVEIPKKTLLLQKGEVEKYLSFINIGIIRYYIEKNDAQHSFGFAFQQEFASAYDSFLTQRPSRYYVEALLDIGIWRISYENLQKAYAETRNGNAIGRALAEQLYMEKFSKVISLKHQTAEERYLFLLEQKPHFIKEIPLHHIASYIGITPQTLSKIRKRIT